MICFPSNSALSGDFFVTHAVLEKENEEFFGEGKSVKEGQENDAQIEGH